MSHFVGRRMRRTILLLTAGFYVFLSSGCHATYYIRVTDLTDPSHPCFVVSQGRFLPWAPGMWNYLDVSEVDRTGKQIRTMWSIQPVAKANVKALCYGKTPAGYKETSPAIPLELNKFYLFYPGGYGAYIMLSSVEGQTRARIYSPSQYNSPQFSDSKLSLSERASEPWRLRFWG